MAYAVVLIAQLFLVGWLAQRWKGRTGAVWAVIAFALDAAVLFLIDAGQRTDPSRILGAKPPTPYADVGAAILVFGVSTAITCIIIATLPKHSRQAK